MKFSSEDYIRMKFERNFYLVFSLWIVFTGIFFISIILIKPYIGYMGLVFGIIGCLLLTKGALYRPKFIVSLTLDAKSKKEVTEHYLESFKYVAAGLFLVMLSIITQLMHLVIW